MAKSNLSNSGCYKKKAQERKRVAGKYKLKRAKMIFGRREIFNLNPICRETLCEQSTERI